MLKIGLSCLLLLNLCSCMQNDSMNRKPFPWPHDINAPVAAKKPFNVGMHGDVRMDDYYWMNAYFKKGPDSVEVLKYLKEENAYLDTMMAAATPLKEKLFLEMKARIKEKDESVPVWKNGYYYYNRFTEGAQYPVYCRKKASLGAPEEVLLDVNAMAAGHDYYSVRALSVSPDNTLLAFGVDTVSRRQYNIYVKNLATGEILQGSPYPTTGEAVWANDNKTLFYTETDPVTLLSNKIKRHVLGNEIQKDDVVYEEKDPSNYIGVSRLRSGKYIVIESAGTLSSEVRYLDADKPGDAFKIFQPRMKNVLYSIDHAGDQFLILTNKDALNFRLMACSVGNTDSASWQEVIPHRSDVLLEGIDVFKDFWVITERKDGLLRLRIRQRNNGSEFYIDFGEPAYSASLGENPEYDTHTLRYYYSSLRTPASTYDYDLQSKAKKLMKQQEVVGGYDPEQYVTERIYATARDGARIPVSIVYKKGFKKDGTQPLLLYGYGSYGYSMDAAFSPNRLSLLNRGFAFAIAHVRGGQEMGRQWYEDGKLFKKKNTFNDFIDVAEMLLKEKYSSTAHLYAMGGSAGGLLMGAICNMRPDLWNGVIADVPFVDVVTTMLDESIPLTTNEFDEWGNPKNKDAYDYMKSYSPYDNVKARNYPNILVTTGLHDSQVQYFEPAKWVARMRTVAKGDHQLFLHTNMEAGHGGASGRFDYLKDLSLEYCFLLSLEGISE